MSTPNTSRNPLRLLGVALLVLALAGAGAFALRSRVSQQGQAEGQFVGGAQYQAAGEDGELAEEQLNVAEDADASDDANEPEAEGEAANDSGNARAASSVPASGLEAYAMLDMNAAWLYFFRDEPGAYENGEIYQDESTYVQYFTGIETTAWSVEMLPEWNNRYYEGVTFVTSDERFGDAQFVYEPISTAHWFNSAGVYTIENLDALHMDNVRDASHMFEGCSSLGTPRDDEKWEGIDLSSWNVSQVEDMSAMFHNTGIWILNLSGWDTSNVRTMEAMFMGSGNLARIDGIAEFDVSNVNDMSDMFRDTSYLSELNLGGWDVRHLASKPAAVARMFHNSALEHLVLGEAGRCLANGQGNVGTCIPDAACPPEVVES